MIMVCKAQPYKGDYKNYRPIANYSIIIVNSLILMAIGFTDNSEGFLAKYGPLIILALLLVCVIYSTYALVKDLKENCQEKE